MLYPYNAIFGQGLLNTFEDVLHSATFGVITIFSSQKLARTNQPLNDIFSNRHNSRIINKWAMELLEYVANFEKRNAIKSQVLADFVVEWTEPCSATEGEVPETPCGVYCNGAWGATGAGAAAVLFSPF
jgi:hypothetical protein